MATTRENLEMTFKGETSEVGLYLAMARRAEEEGHPEVAMYLRQVAQDESWHAAEVGLIAGMIKDTRANLEMLVKGETGAHYGKTQAAELAKKEGQAAAAAFFERAAKDEDRHRAGFQSLLNKLSR